MVHLQYFKHARVELGGREKLGIHCMRMRVITVEFHRNRICPNTPIYL